MGVPMGLLKSGNGLHIVEYTGMIFRMSIKSQKQRRKLKIPLRRRKKGNYETLHITFQGAC